MFHRFSEYRAEYQQLNGPAEPELWYWHLFLNEEKINGGVADSRERAENTASDAKFKHHRAELTAEFGEELGFSGR